MSKIKAVCIKTHVVKDDTTNKLFEIKVYHKGRTYWVDPALYSKSYFSLKICK